LNSYRCKLVIVRAKPWSCREHPDAIGWNQNGESVVIECKVSVADFTADRLKAWRTYSKGMGFKRYYMIPEELWNSERYASRVREMVPRGIGVLIVTTHRVKVEIPAEGRQDRDWAEEVSMLVSRIAYNPTLLDGKNEVPVVKVRDLLP
jgi:hypothetical protein